MRHDRIDSGLSAQRKAWAQAEQDLADADGTLAAAQAKLQEAEVRLERCTQRTAKLQGLFQSAKDKVTRWWRLAARCNDALLAIGEAEASSVAAVRAEQALQAATMRAGQATARVAKLRQQAAQAYASRHAWGSVIAHASRLLEVETSLQDLAADDQILDQRMAQARAHADDSAGACRRAQASSAQAKQAASAAGEEASRLAAMHRDLTNEGFCRYLARASPADRATLLRLNDEAQSEGQRHAGRPPASAEDPRAASKARRAAQARERRARLRSPGTPQRKEEERAAHRRARQAVRAAAPGDAYITPLVRHHQQRMQTMAPDERVRYQRHVEWSRARGHAAAIADAEARSRCPTTLYQPVHPAIALGNGARLIAVRGGVDAGFAETLSKAMLTDNYAIEHWLGDPLVARQAAMGSRSRLVHGAIHMLAAWSPSMREVARKGGLDMALAREVDLLIARFDLRGHRVAAILHTDSDSGHPHLHIVASRVRDADTSLWSLPGRERAVALWLHGRSNTAMTFGMAALDQDIDALAGRSAAALAGEALLAHGQLAVLRSHVRGGQDSMPVQGGAAAARVAAVGTTGNDLAGGMWLFGLGVDPQAEQKWQAQALRARVEGEAQAFDARPLLKRGYWLDQAGVELNSGLGRYLSRQVIRIGGAP